MFRALTLRDEFAFNRRVIELVLILGLRQLYVAVMFECIRLETKSCRILPLTCGTKYDTT